jgi:tetratricopeptide (TPR) repeat protein
MMLSMLPKEQLREDDQEAFELGLAEYREAMLYNADLAPQRFNLGNLTANLGDVSQAISAYKKSIAIDEQFYPAKVNLAMLYNRQGKNTDAEKLLREVAEREPELYEVSYSLGLLLAEMQQYQDAEHYLGKAAAGMNYGRAHYNHGQVLLVLDQPEQAEIALMKALSLAPESQEFFIALAQAYLANGQIDKVEKLANDTLRDDPGHRAALELLQHLGR